MSTPTSYPFDNDEERLRKYNAHEPDPLEKQKRIRVEYAMKPYEYFRLEIIESPLLKGHEIAIKSGDKLYVWPDFNKPDELRILQVPDIDEIIRSDKYHWDEKLFSDWVSGNKQTPAP